MKYFIYCLLVLPFVAQSQSIGLGTNTPDASAMLDVTSETKGLLIPRMTEVQKLAIITPARGLLVFQTDAASGFYFNSNTPASPVWVALAGAGGDSWSLTGNTGTNPANAYLGTADGVPLRFRVSNVWAGSVDPVKGTSYGFHAGENDVAGNTAFGILALKASSNATYLTAFGNKALENNSTGYANTAVGGSVLRFNTIGYQNTAIGASAMEKSVSGIDNIAIGAASMLEGTGSANVAIGNYTLANNQASQNVAIGSLSLVANTTGARNVGVGSNVLGANTTGLGNVAIGYNSLVKNTIGLENTAVGFESMQENLSGNYNTAIGSGSLSKNLASYNTAVGTNALEMNTNGVSNTSIGYFSLQNNMVGNSNTAIGSNALANSTASHNTAVGAGSLKFSSSGLYNTAIGSAALGAATSTTGNTAVGYSSQGDATTGDYNTSLGHFALEKSLVGTRNTAVGANALKIAKGDHNTAVGEFALGVLNTGNGNTALGQLAYSEEANGTNNTAIGYKTNSGLLGPINTTTVGALAQVNCSNCMVLGSVAGTNGATETVNVGIGTNNPVYRLQVGKPGDGSEAQANAWNAFSDERYKKNIEEIPNALGKIESLHGYYYNWKTGSDESRQAGLLAQEVEKVLPEIVSTDREGYKSIEYGKMNALLLQAIKELQVSVIALQQENGKIKKQLDAK